MKIFSVQATKSTSVDVDDVRHLKTCWL
jgi:hypothetical protein